MRSAFLSLPGTVFIQSFFIKNTWYEYCWVDPDRMNIEKLIILEWWKKHFTISVWSSLGDPLREVADEIEEELILGDAEDLVRHLHKQAEALAYKKGQLRRILLRNLSGHQVELLNQGFAEILSSRGGLDQDCLDFDFLWNWRKNVFACQWKLTSSVSSGK